MVSEEDLLSEFGENPLRFFWVLQSGHKNKYLNLERQTRIWDELLAEEDCYAPYKGKGRLRLISDNGDLVLEVPEGVVVCNPRDDLIELHRVSLSELLRRVRELPSDIIPEDL